MLFLQSWWLRWFLIISTLGFSLAAILLTLDGRSEPAGQIASAAAAFATILLVSLTASYAAQTRELVDENRQYRKQEKKEREKDRRRNLDSLRRGLYQEIRQVQYYEKLAEEYNISQSISGFVTPTTVYEMNAGDIGYLTDEEIDNIVEFYTRIEQVEELMEVQETLDTTVGMHPVKVWFRIIDVQGNMLLRKLTFGLVGSQGPKDREELIRKEIEKLHGAQQDALSALSENLETVPPGIGERE